MKYVRCQADGVEQIAKLSDLDADHPNLITRHLTPRSFL